MKCTNDRYLNDASVCEAVVAMMAQIGLMATLDAMPVRNDWTELRADNFDMYLLGRSPGTFDAEHPLRFPAHTATDSLGTGNFGGFSNPRIDVLLPQIQSEIHEPARQAVLDQAAGILQAQAAYGPLYMQPLLWGAGTDVSLTQRPDNFCVLRWVRVGG
jgi:peptide/nickel transport system substrate-binding protein